MSRTASPRALMLGLSLLCLTVTPTVAQEVPAAAEPQAARTADAATAVDPCAAPKKKKKKGLGLGGLFKAAQASGLTNLAGMGGLGKGGALANAAIGTAAAIGDSAGAKEAAQPQIGGC